MSDTATTPPQENPMTDQPTAETLAQTPLTPNADRRHYAHRARALYNGEVRIENGYEANLHGLFSSARGIVDRLRRAAADVERHILSVHADLDDMQADHTASAADVLSDVRGMLGNLPLDGLVRDASRVDRYVRGPEWAQVAADDAVKRERS